MRKKSELVIALEWIDIIHSSPLLEYEGKKISTNAYTAGVAQRVILPTIEVNDGARALLQGVIEGYTS